MFAIKPNSSINTCFESSGENSWNGFDRRLEFVELLLIVDCKLLDNKLPLFIFEEFLLLWWLFKEFDALFWLIMLFAFCWCNCDPGALLWELLFDPILEVLADSLLSALPFCNTFEKNCRKKIIDLKHLNDQKICICLQLIHLFCCPLIWSHFEALHLK